MLDAVEQVQGIFLITADHGNAEDMVKRNLKTGAPIKNKKGETEVLTSHTCNPVRFRTSHHNGFFCIDNTIIYSYAYLVLWSKVDTPKITPCQKSSSSFCLHLQNQYVCMLKKRFWNIYLPKKL